MIYNKLVRDRIPEIIESKGGTCQTRILSDEEYAQKLDQKLGEELAEYLAERSTAPSCTGRCHKDYDVYGELRTFCHDCWLEWLKQEAESGG